MVTGRTARGGYTLVALVVIFTLLTIAVAVVLPAWTTIVRRDKEAELIFRGLQYAEAIRVFQTRFGRYPVRLDELLEVEPRSIRQLWKDPMTDSGSWGLIFARGAAGAPPQGGGAGQGAGGRPQRAQVVAPQDASGLSGLPESGRRGEVRTVGPIAGVHSTSGETSLRVFFGAQSYDQWKFTADLIPAAEVVPGSLHLPRVRADWIGRPFPEDLGPEQGEGPGGEEGLGRGRGPDKEGGPAADRRGDRRRRPRGG